MTRAALSPMPQPFSNYQRRINLELLACNIYQLSSSKTIRLSQLLQVNFIWSLKESLFG